jgi:hypothetical protein
MAPFDEIVESTLCNLYNFRKHNITLSLVKYIGKTMFDYENIQTFIIHFEILDKLAGFNTAIVYTYHPIK